MKTVSRPHLPSRILSLFLPAAEREFIIGDLEEQYEARQLGQGPPAYIWLWMQVLRSIGHQLSRRRLGESRRQAVSNPRIQSHQASLMQSFIADLRFAIRSYLIRPGFALSAIALMGIGIGATTTIFSVVDTVLIRPLPYPDPDRLVLFDNRPHSFPNFAEWREHLGSVSTIGALTNSEGSVSGAQDAEHVWIAQVTHEFLPMLGATPIVGRIFGEYDMQSDGAVVVLGYGFWQQRWGSDPDVVGSHIRLDGESVLVTGVMSPAFSPPEAVTATGRVDVWRLLDEDAPVYATRNSRTLGVVARLASGVTIQMAQQELDALTSSLGSEFPEDFFRADGKLLSFPIVPLHEATTRRVSDALLLLLGAVGLMLLIACANVANLFLAQGTARAGEISLRGALGASGRRLTRQLLTESALLAFLGGAVGIAMAFIGVRLFLAYGPADMPRAAHVSVDLRILLFALAASVGTGVLCGLFPVMQALRTSSAGSLRDTSASVTAGRKRLRLRNGLVVAELALTVVLLIGAGLLFRSLSARMQVDPGFVTSDLIVLPLELGGSYTPAARSQFLLELSDRVLALPGTQSVSAGWTLPFVFPGRSCCWASAIFPEGGEEDELFPWTFIHPITPRYFETLGVSLATGREFSEADAQLQPNAAILNAHAAVRLFDTDDAVGRSFMIGRDGPFTVIGVEPGLHHWGLDEEIDEAVYLQYGVEGVRFGLLHVAIRSTTPLQTLAPTLRSIVRSLDPDLATDEISPMSQLVAGSLTTPRFLAILFGLFSAVALVLACGGIYASMLYSVGQRRREMGIRLALGADGARVTRMILRDGVGIAGLGLAIGVCGAVALSRLMERFVWGISTGDLTTYIAVCLLLAAAAMAGCWFPARRASCVDPLATLRAE